MKRKQVILTVGLPRSGKSTWARKQDCPVVNPDSIRLALHGQPFVNRAEEFVWAIAHIMARALIFSGHERIIIDATNITEKKRDSWRKLFPNCDIILKEFDTPKDVCVARALRRG